MSKELSHSQDTEMRILQAAEEEFFEKGYAGARTASIAEKAGVTHAMLHYYFRTKDNLFERIVSGKIEMLGDIILKAVGDGSLPLEERIRQGIEQHFDFIAAHPSLPRFIVNEVCAHPERLEIVGPDMQGVVKNVLGDLQREIDESAARGLCVRADARELLIDIVSLNVFPFIAASIVKNVVANFYESYDAFLAERKRANVETILRKLQIRRL